ncbi:MAG: P-loop NTPase [Candidatus Aminicenantes bacterium]|nr:P-loop NTPase [Candidatus Aminicenantes bacterium]
MNLVNLIPSLSAHQISTKTIWAIGGGKGGTGKSFITANLALHLASKEEDIVVIDADFGGPNLHTFFGMKETEVDLGHFFSNKIKQLKDTAVVTPFKGLQLIRGTDSLLFTANLNYYKKLKLIQQIKEFDAKRVIIDLGTGASYNCIDFFLLSNPGILVVNPEPTSIENAYYFLKSCIIRILKIYIDYYKIEGLVQKISSQIKENSKSIYTFLNEIISYDKYYANVLFKALKRFKPCLIINKARDEKDYILGHSITQIVQKYLVVDINFLGVVPFDEKVHLSVKNRSPYLPNNPDSEASICIRSLTEKLLESSS